MKKITLVDDNRDNLDVLSILFEDEGFHVLTASSAAELFKSIDGFFPDLIFLDVMLGADDGTAVCAKLKNDPKTSMIKVVLMTASNILGKLQEQGVKADRFLAKPFDIDEVAAIAKDLTGR